MAVDLDQLSIQWHERWAETPPIAFLLRELHPDRWVRFHSLPASKRYAETESEAAEVVRRHHAVLDALGLSVRCFVILPRFASEPWEDTELPEEAHWRTVDEAENFDEPALLHVSRVTYPSDAFDALLRAVADRRVANVIIGPEDLAWLYHPYDGGADVIASTPAERDRLRADLGDWLSPYPHGL